MVGDCIKSQRRLATARSKGEGSEGDGDGAKGESGSTVGCSGHVISECERVVSLLDRRVRGDSGTVLIDADSGNDSGLGLGDWGGCDTEVTEQIFSSLKIV